MAARPGHSLGHWKSKLKPLKGNASEDFNAYPTLHIKQMNL